MDRDERRRLTERFEAIHLSVAELARSADVPYLRVYRFIAGGGVMLSADEHKRIADAIARREAIRQLARAGAA
jgi:hypothetical protein